MTTITLTDEGKKVLADNGWEQGIVAFGLAASEATCKLAIGLPVLGKDAKWVSVSFDGSDLRSTEGMDAEKGEFTPGAAQSLGVKSELYKTITNGYCSMPVLAIDGQMYSEADQIILMLAKEAGAAKEVLDLIQLSVDANAVALDALRHWGWCGLHASNDYAMVNKEHYAHLGKDNSDPKWEKAKCKEIKTFLGKLESELSKKDKINGYFVGDSITPADAALFNWVQSFEGVTGLDVKKHYPKLYENWEAIKSTNPDGSGMFVYGFPVFCGYVAAANKEAREGGFDINKYWEEGATDDDAAVGGCCTIF